MIDTDKYEGHTEGPWEVNNPDGEKSLIFSVGALRIASSANTRLIADAPLLLAEVERLSAEVRMLRGMVCLLEDSRITNMSILDRPELFADVAEVFRQRKEDTHGHLPNFGEEE